MKKICHITTAPQNQIRRVIKECSTNQRAGYTPYIVSQGRTFTEKGVHFIGIPANTRGRFFSLTGMTKILYLKGLELDADVYQLHAPSLLRYALKLKRKGKKVIFDSHEYYGEQIREKYYIPGIFRNIIAQAYMVYEACICNRIDAVVHVCTLQGRDYFKGRAARAVTIANVPVLEDFVPFRRLNFEERSIAYIGTLTFERGITHLVKAAARARVRLILCGAFIRKEYLEELMELQEYSSVDYRGLIGTDEINTILKECFAGLSTLLHVGQYHKIDTLPTKVYEYMAMGLPVIISDTPYAKRMVGKYKFGVCVNPSDIDEIADSIAFLLNNQTLAKEMGENGRKAVVNEFNWQIEEEKLIELYNDLQ